MLQFHRKIRKFYPSIFNKTKNLISHSFGHWTTEQDLFLKDTASSVFFSIWVIFHQHSRFTGQHGKGRLFLELHSTTSTRFTDTSTLTSRLLRRAHLYTYLAAGLELVSLWLPNSNRENFGFRMQVANN